MPSPGRISRTSFFLAAAFLICSATAHASTPSATALANCGVWSQIPGSSAPGPPGSMVYDPVRDRMLVLSWNYLNPGELWELPMATNTWSPLTIGPSNLGGLMVYDSIHDRLVVVRDDEEDPGAVWFYPLSAPGGWSRVTASGPPPYGGACPAIFDSIRNRVIVMGGIFQPDPVRTYALDLSASPPSWSVLTSFSPPRRMNGGAIYDPVRDRMVLFGGTDGFTQAYQDLWQLNLSGTPVWTHIPLASAPPPRYGLAAVYDTRRDRMLIFSGQQWGPALYADTWEIAFGAGNAVTNLTSTVGAPTAREGPSAAYDPESDRVVAFGGSNGSTRLRDTWQLPFGNGLTVLASPAGGGEVARDPDVPCPEPGTSMTLTAQPAVGYAFSHWSGDASGSANPLSITVGTHQTITAHFIGYTVTVAADPIGSGTVQRAPNQSHYAPGSTVTLTATPAVGYGFSHWSGDASGSTNPLTLTVGSNLTITAHFDGYTLSTSVDPPGTGTVQRNPSQPHYAPGTEVTLTAIPFGNAIFSHWSGDVGGASNPTALTMNASAAVVAHFDIGPPIITLFSPSIGPVGTVVTVNGSGFAAVTAVDFNGTPASFAIEDDGRLRANVPSGATTGPIHVISPHGSATSERDFRVGDVPPAGINLSWDDCGVHGTDVKTFACGPTTEPPLEPPFRVLASFLPPAGVDEFLGMSGQLDITSPTGALPEWWKHWIGYCRGVAGLTTTFDFSAGPTSCADPYLGQAVGGFAYDVGFGSPARARLRVQAAIPIDDRRSLEPGTEYYAFSLNILRTRTATCAGCEQPMCIVLNEIQLFQPPEAENDPQIVLPHQRQHVGWQSVPANCPLSTATTASVIETRLEPGSVRLTWLAPLASSAVVERRESSGDWAALGTVAADGDHRIVYEDRSVVAGATYRYRLALGGRYEGEIAVAVPLAADLALQRAVWTPNGNALTVSFTVPHRGSVAVEMFDAAGRRLARRALEGLAAGAHQIDLPAHASLAAGVYFVRVSQGADAVGGRFAIVR